MASKNNESDDEIYADTLLNNSCESDMEFLDNISDDDSSDSETVNRA